MNTTTHTVETAQDVPGVVDTSHQTMRGKVSRFAMALVTAVLAATALTVGPALPAHAMQLDVTASVCFQAPFYTYGTTQWLPLVVPVYIDASDGVGTATVATVTPNRSGCVVVNLVSGFYYKFRVNYTLYGLRYNNSTIWKYMVAGGSYPFGNIHVVPLVV